MVLGIDRAQLGGSGLKSLTQLQAEAVLLKSSKAQQGLLSKIHTAGNQGCGSECSHVDSYGLDFSQHGGWVARGNVLRPIVSRSLCRSYKAPNDLVSQVPECLFCHQPNVLLAK